MSNDNRKDAVPSHLQIDMEKVLRLAFRFATAQDLLRRAYDGMHKDHWAEGESKTEVCQAIRDFLDEQKGLSWKSV